MSSSRSTAEPVLLATATHGTIEIGEKLGPQSFRCGFEGCGKHFTRKDHLVRHSANHNRASFHCPTCHRPFKRLDLLQRHEKRNVCSSATPPADGPPNLSRSRDGSDRDRDRDRDMYGAKRRKYSTSSSEEEADEDEEDDELERERERGEQAYHSHAAYAHPSYLEALSGLVDPGPHDPHPHPPYGSTTPYGSTFALPTGPAANEHPHAPTGPGSFDYSNHAPQAHGSISTTAGDIGDLGSGAVASAPGVAYAGLSAGADAAPIGASGTAAGSTTADWLNIWQSDPWDGLMQDALAAPFGEGAMFGGGAAQSQSQGTPGSFLNTPTIDFNDFSFGADPRAGPSPSGAAGVLGVGSAGSTGLGHGHAHAHPPRGGRMQESAERGSPMPPNLAAGRPGSPLSASTGAGVGAIKGEEAGALGFGGGNDGSDVFGSAGAGFGIGAVGLTGVGESANDGLKGIDQALLNRVQAGFPDFTVSLTLFFASLSAYWTHIAPTFPFIHRGTFFPPSAPSELLIMMTICGSQHVSASDPALAHGPASAASATAAPGSTRALAGEPGATIAPTVILSPVVERSERDLVGPSSSSGGGPDPATSASAPNNAGSMPAPLPPSHPSHTPPDTRPPPRNWRALTHHVRGVLVQNIGLEMPISTLQAFCLCHVHDTWYGDGETQFVAQCMWPVMSAHSRKKGIGVAGKTGAGDGAGAGKDEGGEGQEGRWKRWAKDEERRRAAFCVLLIDTQLSAFWNQHPSRQLSIFAHNIALPCSRSLWDAPSSLAWHNARLAPPSALPAASGSGSGSAPGPGEPLSPSAPMSHARKPRPGYLPGLHPEFQVSAVSEGYSAAVFAALAAEQPDHRLPFRVDLENKLADELVLIGLMAVAWDCRTRGGMGIRLRDGTKHWRGIVLHAVINLRAAWENAVHHIAPCTEIRDMRDSFAISVISVLSDIPMLQVAAGATSVCGATIGPRQYQDAKRRLKLWSKTEDAWTCLWQSARYLRQALWADWGLYSPLAVFLATLTCWAYAHSFSPSGHFAAPSSAPETAASALLDHILHSPHRIESLEREGGVPDLVACAAEKIETHTYDDGAGSGAGAGTGVGLSAALAGLSGWRGSSAAARRRSRSGAGIGGAQEEGAGAARGEEVELLWRLIGRGRRGTTG